MDAPRKPDPTPDPWMSLLEASKTLDESRQTVLVRAVRGEVAAAVVAGRTVVDRASVERIAAEKRAAA